LFVKIDFEKDANPQSIVGYPMKVDFGQRLSIDNVQVII